MSAIAEVASGIFSGVVKPILDKWIPDAQARLEATQFFFKQAHEVTLAQIEVNKEEAKNPQLFVSGWRPFVGWVCGGNLAYAVVGHSVLSWVIDVVSVLTGQSLPPLPKPDLTLTAEVLVGLLGLGAFRTYEKTKGVAST